jgi:hypothetical protein
MAQFGTISSEAKMVELDISDLDVAILDHETQDRLAELTEAVYDVFAESETEIDEALFVLSIVAAAFRRAAN